jgi:hypothetical protein
MKRPFIFFMILETLICWGSFKNAFSQADAGEDKFFMKGDPTGAIIGGDDPDPDWCYAWEPKEGLSDPRSPNPIATPDSTTTYKLKVVGYNFEFTSEDEVTVYVMKRMSLKVENNITECMERREITLTSIITGNVPVEFPDDYELIFHYKKADGTDVAESQLSSRAVEDYDIEADLVPDGDADHKYTTTVYAEAKYKNGKLTSDSINIDVYELWIDYVKHMEDSTKEWKIVVGHSFRCNAIASSDCINWKWSMEDGFPDQWELQGITDQKTALPHIPWSNLEGAENSDFGDTYGTLTVSCEDADGNEYTFNSTDMTPSRKVQVFFNPNVNIEGLPPSTEKPPCWFIFWKDGGVVEDMDLDFIEYDHSRDFGAWVESQGKLYLGPMAVDSNSGPEYLFNMDGVMFEMTGQGVHLQCVAETITHELYHKYVDEVLKSTGEHHDSDELPDQNEQVPGEVYFYRSDPYNNNTFSYALYASSGYADQEVRCRILEIQPGVKKIYPALDWSMDPLNPKW